MGVKVRERPKGKGVWWVFIDHNGQRKAKKIGRDKKLAEIVAKKIEAKLVLGELRLDNDKEKSPLFKEYANNWLNTYIKQMRRISTYERYKDVLEKHVIPILGSTPIAEIKRGDVRNLFMKLHSKGLSTSFIGVIYATINGPLAYALEEDLITSNPVVGLTKIFHSKTDATSIADFLSKEDVNLFLSTCNTHFHNYYPFFLTAFRTGMRLGELLGLQWGDIEWNNKSIEVRRSYKIRRYGPTKTGKIRRVDVSDQLLAALRSLYLKRREDALAAGQCKVIETMFHKKGIPMAQNSIRETFKRILVKAGIREIRFHDIRHTFASLLLSNGESPVYVKEQLGHSSIQMTVDIYGHLIPGSNRQAVNRLDTQPSATYPQPRKKDVV